MSQHPLTSYEQPQLPGPAGEAPGDGQAQGIGPLLMSLRRRWRIVLLVWCVLAPIGVAGVWMSKKPMYTATALVEVAPIVRSVLYEEDDKPIPMFDSYLNTQTQLMASQQVLTAALADPAVRDLPLLQTANPLAGLRGSLSVRTVPRTNLIEAGVTQGDADSAIRLTKAVLSAYMARAAGEDQQQERTARQALEQLRESLRNKLDQQSNDIRRLAEAYGTSSDKMFEILRESLEKYSLETKQELERADLEIYQLQEQMKQLESGAIPTSQPQEWYDQRQQAIDNEPGVRLMRQELEKEQAKYARLRAVLGSDHQDTKAAQQKVERTQEQLTEERHRAAGDIDKQFAERHKEGLQVARARLADTLAAAQRRRQVLQERVDKRDAEGMSIGRQGLEIQNLREQRELTRQDYERVVERLKRMEIESQRPARISIASTAEIRPDGLDDKRAKLSLAAILGSLAAAVVLGLIRDRLDPHVQNIQQVETGTGLRLLGIVPAAADLHAGRITREEYLESFRVIRASLTGTGTSAGPRSILVTSAQSSEGKTSLAVSLAISLTESCGKVLLIDGDIQVPQVARLLKISPTGDLRSVMVGNKSLAESVCGCGVPNLSILAGHSNGQTARGILNAQSAKALIKQAAKEYDFVVVDSPPALGAADSLFWALAVDGVVVASMVGHSDRHAVRLACQRLTSIGARLLGTVIANVRSTENYYSYSTSTYRSQGPGMDARTGTPGVRPAPVVYLPNANDGDKPAG